MTESGWTTVKPSADSRQIYVSSSAGNDDNDASEAHPVKTFAKARTLLRPGYPDWLLLKAGDSWVEEIGTFIETGGRSADEPMVITSYGTGDRPIISPTGTGVRSFGHNGSNPSSHIYLLGLDFYDPVKDPASPSFQNGNTSRGGGITWLDNGTDFLVEGCSFRFLDWGVIFQHATNGYPSNIRLRRNLFLNGYGNGSFSQATYWEGASGITIEENVFDHNGWVDPVAGVTVPNGYNGPGIFNHDAYFSACSDISIKRNLFLRGSSLTLKFVSYVDSAVDVLTDGLIDDNFFFESEASISMNYGNGSNEPTTGSVFRRFQINNNVFSQINRNNPTARGLGWTVDIGSCADSVVSSNIFSDLSYTDNTFAVRLRGASTGAVSSNISVRDNIAYRVREQAIFLVARPNWSTIAISDNTIVDPGLGAAMVSHYGPLSATTYSGNHYSPYDPANVCRVGTAINGSDAVPLTYAQWLTQSGETGSQVQTVSYPAPSRTLATYAATLNSGWAETDYFTALRGLSKSNWTTAYLANALNNYIRAGFGVSPL